MALVAEADTEQKIAIATGTYLQNSIENAMIAADVVIKRINVGLNIQN